MAVEIGVFRLIREALYFWSTITATTSKSCGSFKLTCQLFTRSEMHQLDSSQNSMINYLCNSQTLAPNCCMSHWRSTCATANMISKITTIRSHFSFKKQPEYSWTRLTSFCNIWFCFMLSHYHKIPIFRSRLCPTSKSSNSMIESSFFFANHLP